jgi:N6-L-threonylcarbamoyladenine synthase
VYVLGIDTSCDDTCAAVVKDGRELLSNVVASQADLHQPWAGVVPEVASRAHLEQLLPVVDAALAKAGIGLGDLDAIGVTNRPGLVPALLVGLSAAKALAWTLGKPLLGVHHIEGHIYANLLTSKELAPPYLSLIVSGGHTQLFHVRAPLDHQLLGETLDDAAGEAFDKVAAMLGLPYPGGPSIEREARQGSPKAVRFPVYRGEGSSLDLSFSGLKTAVLYHLKGQDSTRGGLGPARAIGEQERADIAASFQDAAVEQLVVKTRRAVERTGVERVAVGGGVACNARLRERMEAEGRRRGFQAFFPPRSLCTDNGAMIALVASWNLERGRDVGLELDARARD